MMRIRREDILRRYRQAGSIPMEDEGRAAVNELAAAAPPRPHILPGDIHSEFVGFATHAEDGEDVLVEDVEDESEEARRYQAPGTSLPIFLLHHPAPLSLCLSSTSSHILLPRFEKCM